MNPQPHMIAPVAGGPSIAGALLVTVAAVLSAHCGQEQPPIGRPLAGQEPRMRIVSLAPALTQMIVDLDSADSIVGVAENDHAAPAGLPMVGNFTNVDTELLLSVDPTHVLTMAGKEKPPSRLVELAGERGFQLVTYPYPLRIEQVGQILFSEAATIVERVNPSGGRDLGTVLGVPGTAWTLKQRLFTQLAELNALTAPLGRPSVLLVIGTNPIMASGPGTVNDELLAHAGGINAVSDTVGTAPTFDQEALLAIDPGVILLLLPGARKLDANDPRTAELAGLPLRAVVNDRIVLLNDPLVLLPSSSIFSTAAAMAMAIHPNLKPQIQALLDHPAGRPRPHGRSIRPFSPSQQVVHEDT